LQHFTASLQHRSKVPVASLLQPQFKWLLEPNQSRLAVTHGSSMGSALDAVFKMKQRLQEQGKLAHRAQLQAKQIASDYVQAWDLFEELQEPRNGKRRYCYCDINVSDCEI
jgi:hypothetical protein